MPNWSLGRTGQVYVIEESAFDTSTTLAATNAVRHLNVSLHYDPKSLVKAPTRYTDPSQRNLYTRRTQGTWGLKGQMYPSGVLNTLPEMTAILKNAFGATPVNTTLSTTVTSGASTTGAVVASATGLTQRQAIQINIASGINAGTYIRFLTTSYSNGSTTLVWEPALPGAPANGDTVKGGITYQLGTTLPKSLDVCHYPQSPATWYNREGLGCVPDKLVLNFDSNLEPQFEVSGMMCEQVSAQAQPGSFTTVGSDASIPSGLTGAFQWGATLYQIEKLSLEHNNAMDLQNSALGTQKAVAMYRKGKRAGLIKVNAKVSSDLTLWTPSLTAGQGTLFLQIGNVSGNIWGLYAPISNIMAPPDTPDADETNNWDYNITPLGNAGNDEYLLGMV